MKLKKVFYQNDRRRKLYKKFDMKENVFEYFMFLLVAVSWNCLLKTSCYKVVVFRLICLLVGNKLTNRNRTSWNRQDCRELKDAPFKKNLIFHVLTPLKDMQNTERPIISGTPVSISWIKNTFECYLTMCWYVQIYIIEPGFIESY